jgi:hypothetical protein
MDGAQINVQELVLLSVIFVGPDLLKGLVRVDVAQKVDGTENGLLYGNEGRVTALNGDTEAAASDVVQQLRCKDRKKAFRGDACIVAHGICLLEK